jgi:thymidine phosphorylase
MVASVLSKKIAAGSTHVVIDIPVGRTAKVRSPQAARALENRFDAVAKAFGITVSVVSSDGSQPVGHGIGPALEAWDVLAVLQNQTGAPDDLRQRALQLAGRVLELGGKAPSGHGQKLARSVLDSGEAWSKLQAICAAQGGMRTPARAKYTHVLVAQHQGRVIAIDNRRLARLAKLAGAPKAAAAGLELHAPLGTLLSTGQPLLTLHAESPGELAYALAYAAVQDNLFSIQEME